MASSLTKGALRTVEAGRTVVASVRTHNAQASAELDALYRPVLREGETMPDWAFVQELGARLVEDAETEVIQEDQNHSREKVKRKGEREDRGRRQKAVSGRLRSMSQIIEGSHQDGVEARRRAGLDRPPEELPFALYQQSRRVQQILRDPDLDLGEPLSQASTVDPGGLAGDMESPLADLGAVLDELNGGLKRTAQSGMKRRQALDRHRRVYVHVAATQESYYRVAGLGDLADRMRPIVRSRPRPVSPQEPQPSPEGTEPSPDESRPPAPNEGAPAP